MKLSVQVLTLTAACLLGRHSVERAGCESPSAAVAWSCPVTPGLELEIEGVRQPATARALAAAATWSIMQDGVELSEVVISAPNEGRRTRLVMLRLDPRQVRLDLVTRIGDDYRGGDWTIDQTSAAAIASINAGQFSGIAPWGWTVKEGRELRPPGTGPLSMAVVEDLSGTVRLVSPDSINAVRARGGIRMALQSFPTLLDDDGRIPSAITTPGLGVDVSHRDARLAMAHLADGRVLILLTRFDALGPVANSIPFGITLEETAALLQAFGATRAVALDGGISAQMLVRNSARSTRTWRGWRRVPAGLEILAR